MKKIICLIVLLACIIFIFPKEKKIEEVKLENKKSNLLSMMLETRAGTGKYQKTLASSWPTEGYVFNEDLSKCEMGSSLSWDNINKKVIMEGNGADKCYVYFDKTFTLAEYVKAQYTGTQGENNLYYHDSSLENGAEDNSYRYAGSSDTTNNFVCFGYDSPDGSCPTDYLYRIIGVFNDQVKLIKYDYANSNLLGNDGDYSKYDHNDSTLYYKGELTSVNKYYWNNNTRTKEWSESELNTVNFNVNYLKIIGMNWSNKIAIHTWKVGGNTYANIRDGVVKTAYKNEITNPATNTTYDAKIGLMYASDYGYAAASDAWTTYLWNEFSKDYSKDTVKAINWMYMGLNEYTISPDTSMTISSIIIRDKGSVGTYLVYFRSDGYYQGQAVRPCFYLNFNVTYKSGVGTISSPFIIE